MAKYSKKMAKKGAGLAATESASNNIMKYQWWSDNEY